MDIAKQMEYLNNKLDKKGFEQYNMFYLKMERVETLYLYIGTNFRLTMGELNKDSTKKELNAFFTKNIENAINNLLKLKQITYK